MKLNRILPALTLLLVSAGMVSCDNDFEYPPVIVPEATMEANTSIAALKQMYWDTNTSQTWSTEIGKRSDGQDIIIAGTIISSDEAGNIYKNLMVRDDDGEAITFSINKGTLDDELYLGHKYGQRIVVDVTGMYIGMYNNQMQIGIPSEQYGISYMDRSEFDAKSQVDGLPGNVEPVLAELGEVNSALRSAEGRQKWQSQLISLADVQFVDGGAATFGDNGTYGNRYITDLQGNRINVRCSGKSSFAYTTLPTGRGTLVGILSQYRDEWQILLNDINPETSLIGFDWSTSDTPTPPVGEITGAGTESDPFTADDVIIMNPTSKDTPAEGQSNVWVKGYIVGYYNYDDTNNQWHFDNTGTVTTNITIASSADETSADKIVAVKLPAGAIRDALNLVQNPGNYKKEVLLHGDILKYCGKPGVANLTGYKLDGQSGGDPNPPTPPTGDELLNTTFATGQGDWTIDNITMDGLSYVWSHDERYACMKASAYITESHASDSYLISPVVDLAGASNAVLTFDHALNKFNSLEMAKTQCTLVVREEGQTSWTALTIPDYGTAASWTFLPAGEISLAAYAGKKIQVAFHYTSTSEASGTWEVKNVIIKK